MRGAARFLLKCESRFFSLRVKITILSLKENKSLDDVVEIRSVTLQCSNNAKGLVCKLLLLTHGRKVLSVLHDEMSPFFLHEYVITLAVATAIFLSGANM